MIQTRVRNYNRNIWPADDPLSAGDFQFSVKAPRWAGYSYMVGLSLPWPNAVEVVFCIPVLFRFLLFSLLLSVVPDILYRCRLAVSTYMVVSLQLPYVSSSFLHFQYAGFLHKNSGLFLPAILSDMKFCVRCFSFLYLLYSISSNIRHIMFICICQQPSEEPMTGVTGFR